MGSLLTGFFVSALLPFLYVATPNPVLFRWYWVKGSAPVPANVEYRATIVHTFLAQGILGVTLRVLIPYANVDSRIFAFSEASWKAAIGYGIAAGLAWLALYLVVFVTFRPTSKVLAHHVAMRWPSGFWVVWSLSSAIIEEMWRVFCIMSLAELGSTVVYVVTATAFGLAHPRPTARAVSTALFGIFAAWLFFAIGSLWTNVIAHVIVNVGLLFLIRFATLVPYKT